MNEEVGINTRDKAEINPLRHLKVGVSSNFMKELNNVQKSLQGRRNLFKPSKSKKASQRSWHLCLSLRMSETKVSLQKVMTSRGTLKK